MKDGLYHKEIGMPAGSAEQFLGSFVPQYSRHAQQAALNDRYGRIHLPPVLNVKAGQVVEVEIVAGRAHKAVVRVQFNRSFDLVAAIFVPEGGRAFVKTVWLNQVNDAHRTLDRSKYLSV